MCSHSGTPGPIWLNFFLLAPSLAWGDFRSKKIRICGPVFSRKIQKKPDNCNFHSISCQIVLKFSGKILLVAMRTNKKIFPDFLSENPAKSGKNRIKPENHISTYYQHVICHFSWLDHGEVKFDTYFEIFWKKIYQKKFGGFSG